MQPTSASKPITTPATDDPYLWFEDVTAPKSLDWVPARNAVTAQALETDPAFDTLRDDLRAILDSDARIPLVEKMGTYYYNFRKDKQHEQQTHMQALAYSFLKRMLMQK